MATIKLKLLVDTEKNRVVFAEADRDFTDIIFSFLTLPLGTIVRLLNKQSGLGCLDKLYEGVENLDEDYFETEACKTMLLQPRSTAEELCEDLAVNINDKDPRLFYRCANFECYAKTNKLFSSVPGVRCPCGCLMSTTFWSNRTEKNEKDGVFVKARAKFVITDEFHVFLPTTNSSIAHLKRLGIKDARILEKRTVDVCRDKVLHLLGRMLLSKSPLTDVFLQEEDIINVDGHAEYEENVIETSDIKLESEDGSKRKDVYVDLFKYNDAKKILYAEAREDFVDVIFSFLTFPLGTVVNLLQEKSSIGCVNNLYESVKGIGLEGGVKSEKCLNVLLKPAVYSYFHCESQLISIETMSPTTRSVRAMERRWNDYRREYFDCDRGNVELTEMNPKSLSPETCNTGGGYVRRSVMLMVKNDLAVSPLSFLSGIDIIKEKSVPINSVKEIRARIGEIEAMKLLRACFISRSALDNAFIRLH